MYYPDDTVEEVIRANDIVDVISAHVQLKKSGANYFGLCPFHNERSPSFSVSRQKQMFYCFGCGEGGNALTFVMKYENCSFQEALKMLADRAQITLPEVRYSDEMRKKEEHRQRLLAVNKEAATYYYRLLRTPKGETGYRYLRGRALSDETMKLFGLGFADGARNDLTDHLRKAGFRDEEILEAGVAAFDEKRGLHDKFWNRVIFPIQDTSNRVIGFGGRVMGDGKPKYLNSPETPVFDKSRNLYGLNLARRSRRGFFILCEGYMDVIAMHQAGFIEAVASLGTSFTEGQAVLIRRYVSDVVLAYDSDEAGTRAALRNIGILRQAGVRCRVLDMKPHKDPDEFIRALGPEELEKRIRDAQNAFFFEIAAEEKNYRMDDPSERAAFCRLIAKRLCGFSEEVERDSYLSALARKYFIREDALRRLVASYDSAGGDAIPDSRESMRQRPQRADGAKEDAQAAARRGKERLLMSLLVDDLSLYPRIRRYLRAEDLSEGVPRECARKLFGMLDESGRGQVTPADIGAIIGLFDDPEQQKEAAALFQEPSDALSDRADRAKAIEDALCSVKRGAIERLAKEAERDPSLLMDMIREKKELEELTAKGLFSE